MDLVNESAPIFDQRTCVLEFRSKMLRPYAIKGRKRKNKTERYDKEEDEEENVGFVEEEEQQEENVDNDGAHKKVKGGAMESDEAITDAVVQELAGIPVNLNEKPRDKNSGGVIFIVENAIFHEEFSSEYLDLL